MIVYRLCSPEEAEVILQKNCFDDVGNCFENDHLVSSHIYEPNVKYMHFFKELLSILYRDPVPNYIICFYDIPDEKLKVSAGIGLYHEFIFKSSLVKVTEYAVKSNEIKFEYLKAMYRLNIDFGTFDYVPTINEIMNGSTPIYPQTTNK